MILYRKFQVNGENSPVDGLWYARPVINETFDIEALSKHMSKHNTPFSPGVIKGVLSDMVSCVKELVLDGKNVKLDDLAIFSVGIVNEKGAESAEAFKVSENVKGLKLRARATGELSNSRINLEATLREQKPYSVGTTTDDTTGGGSGGGSVTPGQDGSGEDDGNDEDIMG